MSSLTARNGKTDWVIHHENGTYSTTRPFNLDDVCQLTSELLSEEFTYNSPIENPNYAKSFLLARLSLKEREVFSCLFLTNGHQVIKYEELFMGTINGASVYPREVVKRALQLNAAAVILAHNHPSGVIEPSQADKSITETLQEALTLIDIRILDHIIVGGSETYSFAENGLI